MAGDFSAVCRSLVRRAIEGHMPAIKLYFEYLMGKPGFKDFVPPPEPEHKKPRDCPTRVILTDGNGRDWNEVKPPGSAGFQPAPGSAGCQPACGTVFQAVNEHGQDARATSGETPALTGTSHEQSTATAATQSTVKTPVGDEP
jgi:hypothetical protein